MGRLFCGERLTRKKAAEWAMDFLADRHERILAAADREKGKLRALIRVSLKNYLLDHQRRAVVRGSKVTVEIVGDESVGGFDEEDFFAAVDEHFASSILKGALSELESRHPGDFAIWRPYLFETPEGLYEQMTFEHGGNTNLHQKRLSRFRSAFREIFQSLVAQVVFHRSLSSFDDPAELDQEISGLLQVIKTARLWE